MLHPTLVRAASVCRKEWLIGRVSDCELSNPDSISTPASQAQGTSSKRARDDADAGQDSEKVSTGCDMVVMLQFTAAVTTYLHMATSQCSSTHGAGACKAPPLAKELGLFCCCGRKVIFL